VGIAEEQRPLVAEALDLPDVRAGGNKAILDALQRLLRVDCERVVIDRSAMSLPATLADDLIRWNLEHVERSTTAEIDDRHPRVSAHLIFPNATRPVSVLPSSIRNGTDTIETNERLLARPASRDVDGVRRDPTALA